MYPLNANWLLGWVDKLAYAKARMLQDEMEQKYEELSYHNNEYLNILHQFEYEYEKLENPPMDKGIANSIYYQAGVGKSPIFKDEINGLSYYDTGQIIPAEYLKDLALHMPKKWEPVVAAAREATEKADAEDKELPVEVDDAEERVI